LILYNIFLFKWLCWIVICSRLWDWNGLPLKTYISMYARTNGCYNERGSRTNYVRSSILHCILYHPPSFSVGIQRGSIYAKLYIKLVHACFITSDKITVDRQGRKNEIRATNIITTHTKFLRNPLTGFQDEDSEHKSMGIYAVTKTKPLKRSQVLT
jgi:hypothetical protein